MQVIIFLNFEIFNVKSGRTNEPTDLKHLTMTFIYQNWKLWLTEKSIRTKKKKKKVEKCSTHSRTWNSFSVSVLLSVLKCLLNRKLLILYFQLCKDIWQLPTRFFFLFLSTYCYSHCKAQPVVLEHHVQIVKRPQQPFGDGIKVVNPFATPADYTTNYTM